METKEHTTAKEVVKVDHLSLAFGDNKVLQDFSIDVKPCENVVVLGKSGSGKSVLIKCIVRLLEPDEGKIEVLGEDILSMKQEKLDQLRRKIGFLFQSDALYDSMTIRENLAFPLRTDEKQKDEKESEELIREALKNVGLEKTIDQYPSELSGGMKKRISLARTLMLKPEIIFYDEPTSGLDSITGAEISDLIVEVREKYKTSALIISHDLYCAQTTSDRVAVLIDGKCHAIGTYDELEQSDDPKVKQFFHHSHEDQRKGK
jgi:phospholipid/cholesterol/gamma-HCH transport system ATP-binding protein